MICFLSRVAVRCGCGEIGIRGGLKIRWGFPRCRFESGQPHHSFPFFSNRNHFLLTVVLGRRQFATYRGEVFTVGRASELRVPPACAASPLPRVVTNHDPPKLFLPSDIARSNSFPCPRNESVGSFRRISSTPVHTARAPPCLCERPSHFRESPLRLPCAVYRSTPVAFDASP